MPMTQSLEDGAGLTRLLSWRSPAFPTGGFSYSHGLEYAVESGRVGDAAALGDWENAEAAFTTAATPDGVPQTWMNVAHAPLENGAPTAAVVADATS